MSVSINTLDISGLLPGSKLSQQNTMHSSLIVCNFHELPSHNKNYRQILLKRNCCKRVCSTLYGYHFSAVNVTISNLTPECKPFHRVTANAYQLPMTLQLHLNYFVWEITIRIIHALTCPLCITTHFNTSLVPSSIHEFPGHFPFFTEQQLQS